MLSVAKCAVAERRRTSGQPGGRRRRGYVEKVTETSKPDGAPADAEVAVHVHDEPLNLNPAPVQDLTTPMADNGNSTFFSPYPGTLQTNSGDDHSDVYAAALITQGDASTQRNQDSQFAASRDQAIHRDVESTKRETAQAKYDLAVQSKDAEIRNADRFSEVKAELAALREKMDSNAIAQLRVDLAETKAEGRAAKQESLLAAILAKLPV